MAMGTPIPVLALTDDHGHRAVVGISRPLPKDLRLPSRSHCGQDERLQM
jgi:hypothetical protein